MRDRHVSSPWTSTNVDQIRLQICMSPDYAIVPEHFQDTFIEACKQAYYEMHPKDPRETGNMARIVNDRHVQRVKRLLDGTKGEVVLGGKIDEETKFCEATIVKNVKLDDVLMSEEIFAPILPVVPVRDVDEAIKVINSLSVMLPCRSYACLLMPVLQGSCSRAARLLERLCVQEEGFRQHAERSCDRQRDPSPHPE